MTMKRTVRLYTTLLSLTFLISGCHKRHPNFLEKADRSYDTELNAHGRHIGGYSRANYIKSSKKAVEEIMKSDIQLINEGHRITLIVPTDKYYLQGTNKLNDLKFKPLNDIVMLIKCFPNSPVYVAGFTDEIGTKEYKETMSQERAQAMVAYLWSHGIPESKLFAEGYGERFNIGNNRLIHGSAYNRRVEIQWTL